MASDLALAYNRIIQPVPHCYPVSGEAFASAVAGAVVDGSSQGSLRAEAAFVVAEGSSLLGFLHLATGRWHHEDPDEYGLIRFLWYEPGQRTAGQALLYTAETYLRQQGVAEVVAFPQTHRYRFYYLPNAYLSDHLGHVVALLGLNGYRRIRGEVHMDWLDYEVVEPTPTQVPAQISFEWRPGRSRRPGLVLYAHRGETQVGICQCVSCGDFTRAEEAQDWCFTTWLGVEEMVQGKGLGRYLLQCALLKMRSAGYRHAAISTDWHNYRAAVLYTNLGYQVVDWTYAYGRHIA